MARRERLGEFLVRRGVISREQLQAALDQQVRTGMLLGETLVDMGFVARESLLQELAAFYGVPFVSLRLNPPDPAAARLVPARLAHRYRLIPTARSGDRLTVAMANPADIAAEDEVRALTRLEVEPVLADADEISEAVGRIFDLMHNAELAVRYRAAAARERPPEPEVTVATEDGPIVALVQSLLMQAVRVGASDLHLEPQETELRVRYRVDGVLHEAMCQPLSLHPAVVARVKVLGGMDIGERRLPQDGRFSLTVDGKAYDFRVSTLPSIHGEKVVLRILDKSGGVRRLNELGFTPGDQRRVERLLAQPYGLFLVVGPTGSGKSTTLSACLSHLDASALNIVTVEDPVEYRLPGVCQMQVNVRAGLTFAVALRHILRQDPDVIMVGEIRDRETAELAVQASLTGHLVLSTLHTNDAPGTVARLLDMGIEPILLASALSGVLAQRLVRLLCPHCRQPYFLPRELRVAEGWTVEKGKPLYRPPTSEERPCPHCRMGYAGRTVISELMVVDDAIRSLILQRADTEAVREAAVIGGMRPMREEGLRRVLAGETSLEEVLRVTRSTVQEAWPAHSADHALILGG